MLRSTSAFWCEVDGVDRFVPAGAIVKPTDPVVVGRENLFVEVETDEPAARRRIGKAKS